MRIVAAGMQARKWSIPAESPVQGSDVEPRNIIDNAYQCVYKMSSHEYYT